MRFLHPFLGEHLVLVGFVAFEVQNYK